MKYNAEINSLTNHINVWLRHYDETKDDILICSVDAAQYGTKSIAENAAVLIANLLNEHCKRHNEIME